MALERTGYGPHVYDGGAPSAGTSEIQTLTIGGTPSAGYQFKIEFEGYYTAAIDWSATNGTLVANIDAALELLPNIGTGGVTTAVGTMTSGVGTITLTMAGNRARQNVPLMVASLVTSAGTSPTAVIATTTAGVDATFRGVPPGALLIDTTNTKLYINTGTAIAPTWTVAGTQT